MPPVQGIECRKFHRVPLPAARIAPAEDSRNTRCQTYAHLIDVGWKTAKKFGNARDEFKGPRRIAAKSSRGAKESGRWGNIDILEISCNSVLLMLDIVKKTLLMPMHGLGFGAGAIGNLYREIADADAMAALPAPFERGKPGSRPSPGVKPTPAGPPRGVSPSPFERGRGRPGGSTSTRSNNQSGGRCSREARRRVSELHRRRNMASHQEACAKAQLQARGSLGAPNTPQQGRGRASEIQRGGTPPPGGHGARERRGGAERGQPPSYGQPGTPPSGAGAGEARGGKERGQPGAHKPPTTPPAGPGPGEARGGPERGQGAYGQPAGQPKGGAPAAAEQGQGKPAKKKGEGTPPPRP